MKKGTRLWAHSWGRKLTEQSLLANGDNVVCQGWYPGAYPKGDGVTLVLLD